VTIVASVKVRDGLILATDSMTQIYGQAPDEPKPKFLKGYENARKLFRVGDLPIGVMTYGLGNIGQRSIEGLMLEFSASILGNRKKMEAVAEALFDFIKAKYEEQGYARGKNPPNLGFYVAGYSPNGHFPEEWEFLLPQDSSARQVRAAQDFGANWRGVDHPFTRLWKGFALRIPNRLAQTGMKPKEINEIIGDLEAPALYDGMPVQDAVNFAAYILRVTIGYTEFSVGPSACGGRSNSQPSYPIGGSSGSRNPICQYRIDDRIRDCQSPVRN
jgi:hypothetical protein